MNEEPKRRSLSHSQIQTWGKRGDDRSAGCEMKWYLTKIARAPQVTGPDTPVGTAFHYALECDTKSRLCNRGALELWELEAEAFVKLDETLDKEDPDHLLDDGTREIMTRRVKTCLRAYHQIISPRYQPIAPPEHEIKTQIGDFDFVGVIDAQSARAIMDWKTAKSQTIWTGEPWLAGEGHHDQAATYLMLEPSATQVTFVVFACHPDTPDYCEVKSYVVKREDVDTDAMRRRIEAVGHEIEDAIATDNFVAKTGPLCAYCGVLGSCKIGQRWLRAAHREPKVPVIYPDKKERIQACPTCGSTGDVKMQFNICARGTDSDLAGPLHSLECKSCGTRWHLRAGKDGGFDITFVETKAEREAAKAHA